MSAFPEASQTGLSSRIMSASSSPGDKTIDVLKRRIAQEARHSHATPFAILEQNVGLEKSGRP